MTHPTSIKRTYTVEGADIIRALGLKGDFVATVEPGAAWSWIITTDAIRAEQDDSVGS